MSSAAAKFGREHCKIFVQRMSDAFTSIDTTMTPNMATEG